MIAAEVVKEFIFWATGEKPATPLIKGTIWLWLAEEPQPGTQLYKWNVSHYLVGKDGFVMSLEDTRSSTYDEAFSKLMAYATQFTGNNVSEKNEAY